MFNVVCIIPARSGSKRLKNKNLLLINQKSLIQHAVDFASVINSNKIIFSSDSEKYYESLSSAKEIIYHHRSKLTSSDNSTDYDLLNELVDNKFISLKDIVVWLRPTSPIRNKDECNAAIKLLIDSKNLNSVRSIQKVQQHPYWMKIIKEENKLIPLITNKDEGNFPNSQSLPNVFFPTCEFDIARVSSVIEQKKLISEPIGSIITQKESTDINNLKDYNYTKFLMKDD